MQRDGHLRRHNTSPGRLREHHADWPLAQAEQLCASDHTLLGVATPSDTARLLGAVLELLSGIQRLILTRRQSLVGYCEPVRIVICPETNAPGLRGFLVLTR